MSKPRIKLRLVPPAPATDKLASAIAYLRERNLYVLDKGARKPKWGIAGEPKREHQRVIYRAAPTVMERFAETISTLWSGK